MIQRVQSIYMMIVLIISILMFILPLATFNYEAETFQLFLTGIEGSENVEQVIQVNTMPIIAIASAIGLFALIGIFLYKKRLIQIRINRLNILLNTVFIALMYFLYIEEISESFKPEMVNSFVALIMPVVNIILLFLANKRIRKDENMVRAADRLR